MCAGKLGADCSSVTGPCQAEVDLFCFETKPGAGRLAKCLKEQLTEQEKPGYAETKISETCKKDLDKFAIDKAGKFALPVTSVEFAKIRTVEPFLGWEVRCYTRIRSSGYVAGMKIKLV